MKAESVGKKGRNEGEGVGSREIEKIREGTSQRNTASEDYPERRRKRERERESERERERTRERARERARARARARARERERETVSVMEGKASSSGELEVVRNR